MSDDRQDDDRVHGGCEGPDAMYVKLISSDGHEFIIKREHALTSGTIKAMLSGPGQFAENETNEVNFREIPNIIFGNLARCISEQKSCHQHFGHWKMITRTSEGLPVLYLQSSIYQQFHGDPRVSHRSRNCP
ncbi:elongin-C-like isoform X1 [Tachypleus tridentatus]|uniref:elongin-C-like isoform X1 n=1 Tax=Tachypleus tridentatus TaxID=6853 RepID=UPI003FD5E715